LAGEGTLAISLEDYQINPDGIDWPAALAGWSWLIPSEFTLWLVNRLCDLFIVTVDGSVHMLDVGAGTFRQLAANRDEFCRLIDEADNAKEWLAISLVDKLVASGLLLQPGQCYGFKMPPVLGGPYEVENCGVLPIPEYLGANGSIHDQLRGVSDGSRVVLRVVE
jgi:Domain of unknown function (DUF1851)